MQKLTYQGQVTKQTNGIT